MNFWYHLCWWLCRVGLFFWHPVFRVTGRDRVPAGSCIFCANHSGMADPIWILLALSEKRMIRIMAKQELRRVPFVGWVMEKFRVIFVNRGAHDIAAYQQCIDALEQEPFRQVCARFLSALQPREAAGKPLKELLGNVRLPFGKRKQK